VHSKLRNCFSSDLVGPIDLPDLGIIESSRLKTMDTHTSFYALKPSPKAEIGLDDAYKNVAE